MSTPDPSTDMPRACDFQFEATGRRVTFMPASADIVALNVRDRTSKLENSREHILIRKDEARALFNWLGIWLHK